MKGVSFFLQNAAANLVISMPVIVIATGREDFIGARAALS